MTTSTIEAPETGIEAEAGEISTHHVPSASTSSGVSEELAARGLDEQVKAETDFFVESAETAGVEAGIQDPELTPRQQWTIEKLGERLRQILERNESLPEHERVGGAAQFVDLVAYRAQLESGGNTLRAAELLSGIGRYMNSAEGRKALAALQHDGTPTASEMVRQLQYIATAPEILSPEKDQMLTKLREVYEAITDKGDVTLVMRELYKARADVEGHGAVHETQLIANWDRGNQSPEGQVQIKQILSISDEAAKAEALLRYVTLSAEELSPEAEKIRETLADLLPVTKAKGLSEQEQAKVLFGVRAVMEVGGDLAQALLLANRGATDLSEYVAQAGSDAKAEKMIDLLTGWRDYIDSSAGKARQLDLTRIPTHDILERAEKGVRFIATIPAL